MFQHNLWRRALKLNRGIYKTTEIVSDAEILKKQLREQANEILSTISVFCHRESAKLSPEVVPPRGLGGPTSKYSSSVPVGSFDLHSVIAIRQPAEKQFPSVSASNVNRQLSNVSFYLPESEICLMLLLDKITVLKTFLFLAKEHNFFSEEKYQILTAACEHLSESAQSELRGAALDAAGADLFSHPVFNSASAEVEPPLGLRSSTPKFNSSASPEVVPPSEVRPPKINSALSDNLLDILSDIVPENTENISDNNETLSDTSNKKAENYISKSIKSRQNKKSFKSYLPKFLKISRPSAPQEVVPPLGFGGPTSQHSPSASPYSGRANPVALLDTVQSDFTALFVPQDPAPTVYPDVVSPALPEVEPPLGLRSSTPKFNSSASPEVVPPLGFGGMPRSEREAFYYRGPTSKHSLSASVSTSQKFQGSSFKVQGLTSRQRKLHDHLAKTGKAKVGDLTALFPEKISEKTIRRDLQVLIDKSLVSQSGSRRWTRYFAYKKV